MNDYFNHVVKTLDFSGGRSQRVLLNLGYDLTGEDLKFAAKEFVDRDDIVVVDAYRTEDESNEELFIVFRKITAIEAMTEAVDV